LSDIVFSENIHKVPSTKLFFGSTLPEKPDEKFKKQLITIFNQNGYELEKTDTKGNLDIYSELYLMVNANKPINISDLLEFIDINRIQVPKNVERLIEINKNIKNLNLYNNFEALEKVYKSAKQSREKNKYGFPSDCMLLVEGITEETLLPVFADKKNLNFESKGIQVVGAGGKNQVARIYYDIKNKLKIPVIIILDADAKEIADCLKDVLNDNDCIYVISEGEFEDILPKDLICASINMFYKSTGQVKQSEICKQEPMVKTLTNLWKEKGFGEFKKSEFAQIVSENIKGNPELSNALNEIISLIKKCLNS